ncbi:MAG: pseudomurein-binding repeat-containing protein, partial [Methanobacterium sp.]
MLLGMLIICIMAMSTIGSSFATADSQHTAENIKNPASIDKNTINYQDIAETTKSSSSETQKTSQPSVPNTENSVTQKNQNMQVNTISDPIPANTAEDNSQDSNNIQNNSQNSVNEETNAAAGENYTNVRGIWLKAEDASSITVAELKNANITDIFVKTNLISAPTYQNVLTSIISKFQNSGIRIHAWITCFKDADGNWINPANATQRTFLLNKISDILINYNINGIHLDYVRYSGVGNNAAYNNANATDMITSFVREVKQLIQVKKPKVALSAAVMPEGSSNAYFYGQDYGQLAKYVDFLVPMIYKGNYGKDTAWIGTTTKYIVDHTVDANGNKIPVIAGLMTYVSDYDTTKLSADDLYKDVKSAMDNGASGYVLFRYGMISSNFLKPPSFTLSEITDAASRVKAFIESNKKLPSYVTVGTSQVKISDFLKLMMASILELNNGITTPITLQNALAPQESTGSFTSGSITKSGYIDAANRINSFINTYGQAPNYVTTTLG